MTVIDAHAVIQALGLPDSCRVEQRVPKKLLLENGVPTASDKRLITDAIEEIQWFAALKPNTIGVPDYRDAQREYLEIAVLVVTLRGTVKPASCSRLAELVHRAVPYPVLLLLVEGQTVALSLAHKRWAQNEASKVVLDGSLTLALLSHATANAALLQRLAAVRGRLSLCADQAAAAKWWLSMPMASVSAEGPMPKALSTRRTSPLMPGCRHQGRACPLRRARMTSNPLIVA